MSKKRFILCQDDLGNYEIRYDDKVFHFLWEVAPILNEQQATIDQLNLAIDDLLSHTSCEEIKKENEQLKKYLKIHSESELSSIEYNLKLYEENEKLRQELKQMKNVK